jgi:hypothetical protein
VKRPFDLDDLIADGIEAKVDPVWQFRLTTEQ